MWFLRDMAVAGVLIGLTLVFYARYQNLDFNGQLAAYTKRLRQQVFGGIVLLFVLNFFLGMGPTSSDALWVRLIMGLVFYHVGMLCLTIGFQLIQKLNPPRWIRLFFYIGVALTIWTIQLMIGSSALDMQLLFVLAFLECLGLGLVLGLVVLIKLFVPATGAGFESLRRAGNDTSKLQHYRDAGLSDQDIQFLRDQLAVAKPQIQSVEHEFNLNAKLRTLEVRYNTVKVCQNYFKDIVKEPTRLVEASDFLYKFLPSLEDILKKYNEINGHVAKNKQTYMILEKSAATIEKLCQSINDAYVSFHEHDLKAMEDELYVANRSLNSQDALSEEQTVEDILNLGKED